MVELDLLAGVSVLDWAYVNGGISGIFYQPKALYENEWVKLQPLGTEGQNYIASVQPYKRTALIIPFGLGYKFRLGKFSTINLDISMRKSFTDYLDDVSTVYASIASLAETSGEVAAALANRSEFGFTEGSQRGNADNNDNYFFLGFRFQKTIGSKNKTSCYFNDAPKQKYSERS